VGLARPGSRARRWLRPRLSRAAAGASGPRRRRHPGGRGGGLSNAIREHQI